MAERGFRDIPLSKSETAEIKEGLLQIAKDYDIKVDLWEKHCVDDILPHVKTPNNYIRHIRARELAESKCNVECTLADGSTQIIGMQIAGHHLKKRVANYAKVDRENIIKTHSNCFKTYLTGTEGKMVRAREAFVKGFKNKAR